MCTVLTSVNIALEVEMCIFSDVQLQVFTLCEHFESPFFQQFPFKYILFFSKMNATLYQVVLIQLYLNVKWEL